MTDAAAAPPPPAPRRRWGRLILWGILIALALAGGLVGLAWYQAKRIAENLAVASPLAIQPRPHGRKVMRGLSDRMRKQAAEGQGRVRLSGEEATQVLQSMLEDRALLGTLRRERRRLVSGLAELPDPLGIWGNLRLEALDLRAVKAEVAFSSGDARVRLTAPYAEGGGHLNLQVELTGSWAPGAPVFTLKGLQVGEVDLLGLVGARSTIRELVESAVLKRTRSLSQRAVRSARIDGDHLEIVLAPPGG